MIQIAVFASGAGSNALKIIDHFKNHSKIRVALIVGNKAGTGIFQIAAQNKIPAILIEKQRFYQEDPYTAELKERHIDFIVLAGFLWKVPPALIAAYPNKIVNIHPALLPNYGGKGMYGHFVHEAVLAAGESESGISIHFIDEVYDHGQVIFQARCPVSSDETPLSLAQKVQILEHQHYPTVIEKTIQLQNHR